MSLENQISVKLTPEQLTTVKTAIDNLNGILKPLLITMTAQQRMEIPKMGDGTEPFVAKVIDYARSNPEFAPPFINVEELEIDFKAVNDLNNIYRPLLQLENQLNDSVLLSGSEAYVAALAYYNSVKIGARMNVPGAKSIYEDLRKRFSKSGSGSNSQDEVR